MNLNLKVSWIKKLKSTNSGDYKYASDDQYREIDIESLDPDDLDVIQDLATQNKDVKGSVAIKQKITIYRKLLTDVKGVRVTKLEPLVLAIKLLMQPQPNKWLFKENEDGYVVPWYVHDVKYRPNSEQQGAAHVTVSLAATVRGARVDGQIYFYAGDKGGTANELLRKKGYFVETPEVVEAYARENKVYQKLCRQTGIQFLATGLAFEITRWSAGITPMERDGYPTRVVMDDESADGNTDERKNKAFSISSNFWVRDMKANRKSGDDAGGDEDNVINLPLHPYVKVFDLVKHQHIKIHVDCLTEYVYDDTLISKLVLPNSKKDLISMLIEGADMAMEDIVKGKTGGIIVICTGPPGVGKTLSAEVFSEQVKRPLYCVQCSQLGVRAEKLEEELQLVLNRAQRWRAILLIDEADVYVYSRGNDINQNAIVGVFLRVLEYYKGVLFMTSNRDTVIDDAIMSRATAWIRYELPDKDNLAQIWRTLAEQYRVALNEETIGRLINCPKLGVVSGRSVKNLLKLSRLLSAKTGNVVTFETIEYVSQFLDI